MSAAQGDEEGHIPLAIAAALTDADGSETLSVTIAGVPAGATLSAGSDNGNGSWTLAPAQLSGLTIDPPHDFSGTITLTVTATSRESSNGATATTGAQNLTVTVNGIGDAPTIGTTPAAADITAASIPLSISVTLSDPSETLGTVQISGLSSFGLNRGGPPDENGVWTLDVADLAGLALVPDVGATIEPGPFTIQISATSADGMSIATGNAGLTVTLTTSAELQRAQDGYISGATVFADANRNGVLDDGKIFATTRADGTFRLPGADPTDPIVLIGGTDISTGLAFQGKLTAPGGSTVVTPLTTLVQTIVEQQIAANQPPDAAAAEAAVKSALGLPNVALTTFDAVAAATAGGAGRPMPLQSSPRPSRCRRR